MKSTENHSPSLSPRSRGPPKNFVIKLGRQRGKALGYILIKTAWHYNFSRFARYTRVTDDDDRQTTSYDNSGTCYAIATFRLKVIRRTLTTSFHIVRFWSSLIRFIVIIVVQERGSIFSVRWSNILKNNLTPTLNAYSNIAYIFMVPSDAQLIDYFYLSSYANWLPICIKIIHCSISVWI